MAKLKFTQMEADAKIDGFGLCRRRGPRWLRYPDPQVAIYSYASPEIPEAIMNNNKDGRRYASLEWRQQTPMLQDRPNTAWIGFTPGNLSTAPNYYVYKPVRRGRVQLSTFTVLCHASQESEDGYTSEALAKVACECHCAIGKWEAEENDVSA